MFVSDLQAYSEEQILPGLKRCREEIKPVKGFVTFNLAILIEKMGVPKGEDLTHAEAEQQWELLNEGISFYQDTPGCYWVGINAGDGMNLRGLAALRRIGGVQKLEKWARLEDWHFTKRDFLKAYNDHDDIGYAASLLNPSGRRGELTNASDILSQLSVLPDEEGQ